MKRCHPEGSGIATSPSKCSSGLSLVQPSSGPLCPQLNAVLALVRMSEIAQACGMAGLERIEALQIASVTLWNGDTVIGRCCGCRRATDFLGFRIEIQAAVPEGPDVRLATGSHAKQGTEKVGQRLARHSHRHIHFTPASASWFDVLHLWLAKPTRMWLLRGGHLSVAELKADVMSFIDV